MGTLFWRKLPKCRFVCMIMWQFIAQFKIWMEDFLSETSFSLGGSICNRQGGRSEVSKMGNCNLHILEERDGNHAQIEISQHNSHYFNQGASQICAITFRQDFPLLCHENMLWHVCCRKLKKKVGILFVEPVNNTPIISRIYQNKK